MIFSISKLLCKLGLHGPIVLGNTSQLRSARTGAFLRECEVCKQKWISDEVAMRNTRTLGGWQKIESPGKKP